MVQRFFEMVGGEIMGPTGKPVAYVQVDNLTTAEAARAARAIVAALEAEFPAPRGRGAWPKRQPAVFPLKSEAQAKGGEV